VHEHVELITEDLVEYLMYHTLTIKVMGMIESKKKPKKVNKESDYEYHTDAVESDAAATATSSTKMPSSARKGSIVQQKDAKAANKTGDSDARTAELERMNRELLAQIEELKLNGGK